MASRPDALWAPFSRQTEEPERPPGSLREGFPAGTQVKRGRGRARTARCTLGTLAGSRWRAASGRPCGQGRAGRAEGRVPSSRCPPRAVMRGWRATYRPRRVYVADLVTDYGREEVGTQSPTAAAQATRRRRRPHVAPTSALMRLSRPLRRREQKAALAAERTGASSPALPSPTPTASLRDAGQGGKKKVAGSNSAPCWPTAGLQS